MNSNNVKSNKLGIFANILVTKNITYIERRIEYPWQIHKKIIPNFHQFYILGEYDQSKIRQMESLFTKWKTYFGAETVIIIIKV